MKKLKNIKAIFIDLDGTLTNSNKQVTETNKKSIKRIIDKGIYVILCSGRSNKDVCEYSIEANTSDYAVSSNGAQIYNFRTKEEFFSTEIEYTDIKYIWDYCDKNNLELILNGDNNQYGNQIFCSDMYKNKIVVQELDDLRNIAIYQIIINSNSFYDMQECDKYIKVNDNLKIANYSREYINKNTESQQPYYIFVNNKSVDKGVAINQFLTKMNIKKEETICIGDRINDITMFKNCRYKVAMENADKELKQLADYITISNDENGVADFLDKYI